MVWGGRSCSGPAENIFCIAGFENVSPGKTGAENNFL